MSLYRSLGFKSGEHTISKEVIGGVTTFLAMSYILAVNPSIFSAINMDSGAVFTATALAAIIGTLVMAFYAKLPFAQAPGMGVNAFFVYTICISMGYSWQFALTGVLIEGILFIIITLTGIRNIIVDVLPDSLKKAIGCGIGLFIVFLGLMTSKFVIHSDSTLLKMGNFLDPNVILFLIGTILTGVLVIRKVPGALLLGIIITTLIGIPIGVTHMEGVLSMPKSIAPIFCKFDFSNIFSADMVIVVLTLLFSDIFNTIGTVVGVCSSTGMIKKDGSIPRLKEAFMADAVATVAGACFGTSTTTTYVESATGVAAGARTGVSSIITAICFVASLFFAPLFLSVPSSATSPVLLIVGLMMMNTFKDINFDNYRVVIPAFLCLITIPFTFSISDGILVGIIFYVILNALSGNFRSIKPSMWILATLALAQYIFL